jgi:hypothetical protein
LKGEKERKKERKKERRERERERERERALQQLVNAFTLFHMNEEHNVDCSPRSSSIIEGSV